MVMKYPILEVIGANLWTAAYRTLAVGMVSAA